MEYKLFLHYQGEVESGPATDVCSFDGKKLLRVEFIPFGFATPTYGDVVAATRSAEFNDHWAFEVSHSGGTDIEDLHAHGGRYALIVDFTLGEDSGPWFPGRTDIMSSLAVRATDDAPGRVYLVAPDALRPEEILSLLKQGYPTTEFVLVHPAPDEPGSASA